MKKTLSLAAVASIVLLAGFVGAPAAGAAVQSYTGCLSPILNAIYDVAPGDAPAHACVRPASVIHLSSGDVTSIAAGTGLAGGGENGDLSLSIASSYRLPQACSKRPDSLLERDGVGLRLGSEPGGLQCLRGATRERWNDQR